MSILLRVGKHASLWRSCSSLALRSAPSFARNVAPLRSYATDTHRSESFVTGTNAWALESLFEQWKADPSSVDASWEPFFRNIDNGAAPGEAIPVPPRVSKFAAPESSSPFSPAESLKIFLLIRAYRVSGHFKATLDPLNLNSSKYCTIPPAVFKELDMSTYGFSQTDLDRSFYVGDELPGGKPVRTLREIMAILQKSYCSNIGVQYMHINNPEEKAWIRQQVEGKAVDFSKEEKVSIFKNLAKAELFEDFLNKKFQAKRFGLNGGEALIPSLEALCEVATSHGVENLVFGMPHRGRLSVMANTLGKPLPLMFNEFDMHKAELAASVQGTGDVKYHLGASSDRVFNDRPLHMSMTANPSHLEAVNPVVEGKTRAKQESQGKVNFNKAMSVLIHGDAAFAGQGVVGETLELSSLEDFTTGGTIHIVVNNQIGFTTVPKYSRSSPYPSEIAKASGAVVLHVNGDDPEAVVHCTKIAVEYRQKFKKDAVIDIYCYRRFGHNELDEPRFTQPTMYKIIDNHPTTLTIYSRKLVAEGVLTEAEVKQVYDELNNNLNEGFKQRDSYKKTASDWLECNWAGLKPPGAKAQEVTTGIPAEQVKELGLKLLNFPKDLVLHPRLKNRFQSQVEMVQAGDGLDWALGEALAFGSLLTEGYDVRLSGQDCERGTFNHRHAVVHCQEAEKTFTPLEHISPHQGHFNVINSSLSENAVLGFEHGYSLESPNRLVIWEAQFGDFCNGAQVVIDQFIASGEQKWLRMSGLTMLLPHGFEGQGPEHSSGRPERFLQLSDEDMFTFPEDHVAHAQKVNIQVANCTTPANFFHILRRQIKRDFRKPLIVFTPKSLLNYRPCRSPISDFSTGTHFQRLIADDKITNPSKVQRLIFSTGKVFYDLSTEREKRFPGGDYTVALSRVEEISPFPFDLVRAEAEKYPNAEIVWVQEEPQNQGAWTYVGARITTATGKNPRFVGRSASAAPATGVPYVHKKETEELLRASFE